MTRPIMLTVPVGCRGLRKCKEQATRIVINSLIPAGRPMCMVHADLADYMERELTK